MVPPKFFRGYFFVRIKTLYLSSSLFFEICYNKSKMINRQKNIKIVDKGKEDANNRY